MIGRLLQPLFQRHPALGRTLMGAAAVLALNASTRWTPHAHEALASPEPAPAIVHLPPQQLARQPKRARVIWMEVTAYCPCKKCCGQQARGITASGKSVRHNRGRFVAADTALLPFGTQLRIPGYHGGRPVEVIDRGGAIKGRRLDAFFPTHQQAQQWGRRWLEVTIEEK